MTLAAVLTAKVYSCIEICRRKKLILFAVGGGSVIDSANHWLWITNPDDQITTAQQCLRLRPIGAVRTLPRLAEILNASVITNEDGWLKRGLQSPYATVNLPF